MVKETTWVEVGPFKIDLDQLTEAAETTAETRMKIAEALCWDEVMIEAMKRLAGNSDSYSSDDDKTGREFLRQVEDHALRSRHTLLARLVNGWRDTFFETRLYWKMYRDEKHRDFFQNWLKLNGFEVSNYQDKEASDIAGKLGDKLIAEFRVAFKLPAD